MYNPRVPAFEPVIGLEVHAELQTLSKMFCACPVVDSTSAEPNTTVCEVCTGMPGTLPVLNARAVEYAVRVALALGCRIAEQSVFARKNYFYPDLPKGYQISQYELPLATAGTLTIHTEGGDKPIRIRRVHLEEDTGKLTHRQESSLIDYNRSGVPLLEIVSEPDLASLEEVKAYAASLRTLLRYLGVTSGDMEKGVIRFEANVSVRPAGSSALGTRTEIKNLNSFRSMLRALTWEVERQSALLEAGDQVRQETLGWDDALGVTVPQRGKEEAHDYRYFPEPDLPPLQLEVGWIRSVESGLPELPEARRQRFLRFGLSPRMADLLVAERPVADFFEAALAARPLSAASLANWMTGEVFGLLNQHSVTIEAARLTPAALAELVGLLEEGTINLPTAKGLLAEIFQHGGSPAEIVHSQGLGQVSDTAAIDELVAQVLRNNPEQVRQYLGGKPAIRQWLFGQVMRLAKGRANPSLVEKRLQAGLQALAESPPSL
jgi:aspartyl-tRNA(Asn)/glutamyl-tRNA(Gln) amidotransferase subunit B